MKHEKNANSFRWYQKSYKKEGFGAQRLYPNEELLRFLGRHFFLIPIQKRKNIKILELACGSCSNLWMIGKEGFKAYGIDFSDVAIRLGKKMLKRWKTNASLTRGNFAALPYESNFFDCVIDVLSLYCVPFEQLGECLNGVNRVLKNGGLFFSYYPSTGSDSFKTYAPSKKLGPYTLDGIKRKNSPYFGNNFPFSFISPSAYKKVLEEKGFKTVYLETVSRTYRGPKEKFEFVVVVGKKIKNYPKK